MIIILLVLCGFAYCESPSSRTVEIAVLDKVTARVERYRLTVREDAQPITHDDLEIRVPVCHMPPQGSCDKGEGARCFVEIEEKSKEADSQKKKLVLGRWMYKDYPNLSFVQHKRYDVWIVDVN